MSAVAVQQAPLLPAFRHASRPRPAPSSVKPPRATPGIITLSKPIVASPRLSQSVRARKSVPATTPARAADVFQPNSAPKSEPRSAKKPRSRPTSDEEHETPSKPRGRRSNADARASPVTPSASPVVAAPKSRRNQSRTRQTPSPVESDPSTPAPALQKPSGRLAKQRRGFTKSTPALSTAAASTPSAPVPVPQLSSMASHPSGLSRSAPLATPALSQTIPARMRRTLTASGPPQVGREDPMAKDVPPSPSPPRRVRETSWKAQGPLTAPLNGGAGFPNRPPHARSPSEALFNLSLDETDDEPQDMPILFGRATRGGDKVYAGGKFQNGPDPTQLPAPSFLSGF